MRGGRRFSSTPSLRDGRDDGPLRMRRHLHAVGAQRVRAPQDRHTAALPRLPIATAASSGDGVDAPLVAGQVHARRDPRTRRRLIDPLEAVTGRVELALTVQPGRDRRSAGAPRRVGSRDLRAAKRVASRKQTDAAAIAEALLRGTRRPVSDGRSPRSHADRRRGS